MRSVARSIGDIEMVLGLAVAVIGILSLIMAFMTNNVVFGGIGVLVFISGAFLERYVQIIIERSGS